MDAAKRAWLLRVTQVEAQLIDWGASHADRDNLVRMAADTGIAKSRIHELTGLARTTIDRILAGYSLNTRSEDFDAEKVAT